MCPNKESFNFIFPNTGTHMGRGNVLKLLLEVNLQSNFALSLMALWGIPAERERERDEG